MDAENVEGSFKISSVHFISGNEWAWAWLETFETRIALERNLNLNERVVSSSRVIRVSNVVNHIT
jgi:hypothetical protein